MAAAMHDGYGLNGETYRPGSPHHAHPPPPTPELNVMGDTVPIEKSTVNLLNTEERFLDCCCCCCTPHCDCCYTSGCTRVGIGEASSCCVWLCSAPPHVKHSRAKHCPWLCGGSHILHDHHIWCRILCFGGCCDSEVKHDKPYKNWRCGCEECLDFCDGMIVGIQCIECCGALCSLLDC
eukprot:TRINITY_DN25118_c0_g1_i1.p1 TRINITY_DN25118_c0_g1~~TRINITY_DN25118_c0_g1_i1.p1  ORF type:complete len:179 (+),score=10.01 TRINITY_DN25118_c0_g1_i1:107-643(+)